MRETVYSHSIATKNPPRRMSVHPAGYLGTIFRRDTKRSLKVPLDFPGPDRLRPASQYFSNFLSRSYGTRSIMTSREQSSFSFPRLPRSLLAPASPQDRSPCIAGCSFRSSLHPAEREGGSGDK